ncbi:MAG TPA: glucans biosynthesis glucosyltransferase MdoH [Xanthobacteraceae bacterium]|nr:glucans biosynthesis glucosyltransferase MdoH [Xanthobacteraceae bacterium]
MSLEPTIANAPETLAAQRGELIPTATQAIATLAHRRRIFSALSLLTLFGMGIWLGTILSADGFGSLDYLMLFAYFVAAPWFVIGFWNSAIGFAILQFAREPNEIILPLALKAKDGDSILSRVAILMTIRNEDPRRAFKRLRTVKASLDATGFGDQFDYFILSDSSDAGVIAAEQAAYETWRAEFSNPERLIYRVRKSNVGFKAGNLRDFCERWGKNYEIMVPLDADSLMTGAAIVRLVRIMQANPQLGILQSLVVGMPSASFFARVFQFGMRHGMRSFTSGSAWWHADCGPFWGHNAAVRIAAFNDYCRLPDLPGRPPFGGHILSHDQIEAVLMRRAGFEVRVLTEEGGSYEENPPALPDFARRDLRWCQGNLQYLKLVGLPALFPTSRMQIAMAIQMFLVSPAIVLFVICAALAAALTPSGAGFPVTSALLFYVTFIATYFAPKLFGIADALLRAPQRYGGVARILVGGLVETIFTFLLVPVSMFNQTLFMLTLIFGGNAGWHAQQRDGYRVPWMVAARDLWPATAFGLLVLGSLAFMAPAAIPWFLPFLSGLVLSIPFAVFTSLPEAGAAAVHWRLCAIPEEFETPAEISALLAPAAER